jgi:hypothetical protein
MQLLIVAVMEPQMTQIVLMAVFVHVIVDGQEMIAVLL